MHSAQYRYADLAVSDRNNKNAFAVHHSLTSIIIIVTDASHGDAISKKMLNGYGVFAFYIAAKKFDRLIFERFLIV